MNQPPALYFRTKENGAAVFRVDTQNRQSRLDMQHIAMVNVKNGKINPQSNEQPTPEEMAEIETWLVKRQAVLMARASDDAARTLDQIKSLAQYYQSAAMDADVAKTAPDLLMAIHDLRSVLVRRMTTMKSK
jgi:hypothetical protein